MSAKGIKTAVVSNIAFDLRPAFDALGAGVDEFVFATTLDRIGVAASDTLIVGDSDEADGGACERGCGFVLVDPLPTAQRPDGLRKAPAGYGLVL